MSKLSKEIDAYQERGHDPELSKMTPGPWIARFSKDVNGFLVGTESGPGKHGWPGNTVGTYVCDCPRESDAQAIAALPDLIEAMQLKLGAKTDQEHDFSDCAMEAALKKAGIE